MPEITNEVKGGHVRHMVALKSGETVVLCRCQQSKEYPLCDGTHRTLENTIGPAIVSTKAADDQK